ncbi:alpha/beta fold hydrolase [Parvularcula maris]|uniref:Alpha/beta hydrolase n=1 Tax=Parvularcula maris TaxID=2965077 RepID=A0A9X2L6I9_9PROT|nr:alpha/beta hydrolase [Parvularcula maris]MCQ8183972.1 alpha/beta hydrolase [Parvularcula maris]
MRRRRNGLFAAAVGIAVALWVSADAKLRAHPPGGRVMVEAEGTGPDVVLIPGLMSTPAVFEDTMSSLRIARHEVTAKGFGGTEAPDDLSAFVEPLANDLAAYLRSEEVEEAVLVGHSMGGVAAMLTAGRSRRISHVVIVDSVPFLAGLFNPNATPDGAAGSRELQRRQLDTLSPEAWLGMAKQGLSRQAMTEESQSKVFADVQTADTAAAKTAFLELMTTDYSAAFQKVDVPVTVLVPFDPSIGFPREAVLSRYEAQYRDMTNVEFRVIEPSRHFIMLDAPDAFRKEIERVLEGEL